jgi:hypothetical protein
MSNGSPQRGSLCAGRTLGNADQTVPSLTSAVRCAGLGVVYTPITTSFIETLVILIPDKSLVFRHIDYPPY